MIILDEFVDVIKVIRIKVIALYAKMPLDRFKVCECVSGIYVFAEDLNILRSFLIR